MSTICFIICILFISTSILALPRLPAPRVVYSAIIYNKQNNPVECNVIWTSPLRDTVTGAPFTVAVNNYHAINESLVDMGTWQARRMIKTIRCGDLVLNAPFQKVRSPSLNWKFHVETNRIVSVGPSSRKT